MLNDNYTAFCVNSDLLQCWRGRQNPSSLYQGIAQSRNVLTGARSNRKIPISHKFHGHVARRCFLLRLCGQGVPADVIVVRGVVPDCVSHAIPL